MPKSSSAKRQPRRLSAVGEPAGLVHVGDRRGLGDLEDQVRRDRRRLRSARPGSASSSSRSSTRVAREVDLEAQVAGRRCCAAIRRMRLAGPPSGRSPGSSPKRSAVARKAAGGDELAVLADHPQQQLVLGDLVRCEVEDRLGVQDEAVLARAPGGSARSQTCARSRAAPPVVLSSAHDAVAARVLGLVHRDVGRGEQLLAGDAARRRAAPRRCSWSRRTGRPPTKPRGRARRRSSSLATRCAFGVGAGAGSRRTRRRPAAPACRSRAGARAGARGHAEDQLVARLVADACR